MVTSTFIVFLVLCTYGCNCVFNDLFGRDNIGLSKLSYQEKCNSTLSDGTYQEGICKTRPECLLTGGIPRGHCGFLSTCCAYTKSCGRSSNAKVSYFSSGLTSSQVPVGLCTYNVVVANENVCQIRLDFLTFQTTPPQSVTPNRLCTVDNFYVTPSSRGIPQICGYNTGQHLYIDVPRQTNNIGLTMKIGSNPILRPSWNIKITQLECPRKESLLHKIDKDLIHDYNYLAPAGCLQYFTETSGEIKSFSYNYNSVTATGDPYASNQHYSICFKRYEYTCGINLNQIYVALHSDNMNCATFNNYLEITGNAVRLCPQIDTGNIPPLTPAGPIHIDFHVESNQDSVGFDIAYDLLTTCV